MRVNSELQSIRKLLGSGNTSEALNLNSKYVENGVPVAMYFQAATQLITSKSKRQKIDLAFSLLKRSASYGCIISQLYLAEIYFFGTVVPQDKAMNHKWLNIAASSGFKSVVNIREEMKNEVSK